MQTGMIIGSSIAGMILVSALMVHFKTKDRKETLVMKNENNTLYFLLGEDEYYSFDVSDL